MDMKILKQKLQLCKSDISYVKTGIILFNDGDVGLLYPRLDTFTVRRRMNMVLDYYDGKILPGAECRLNFLTFILQLSKHPENWPDRGSNPGPLGDRKWRYSQITTVVLC